MPPVSAVRGPSYVGIVVGRVFSGGCFGPGSESDVVGFEDGFRHLHGGSDQHRGGSEFEVHDGPVFPGESMDGSVWEWAYEVEVSDYGP